MPCNTENSTVPTVHITHEDSIRLRLSSDNATTTATTPTSVKNQFSPRQITWQELSLHNKPDDAWIGIDGKVYDITQWMDRHPGGRDVLEMVAGREATHLFESYHLLRDAEKMLGTSKVPLVGDLISTEFPLYTGKSAFYDTLRDRVADHFKKAGKIKHLRALSPYVIVNTIVIFSGLALSYYFTMYASGLSFAMCALFAVLSGIFHHLSMVHLFHDLSHNAYSHSPTVWRVLGNMSDIITGHSCEVWRHRHVLGHHIYTNVCGIDPDLGIYKAAPTRPMMKYRAKVKVVPLWFQPFLYLFVVGQMQLDDFFSQWRQAMENVRMNPRSFHQHAHFWGGKLLFLLHRVILPIYLGCRGPMTAVVLFLITEAVGGMLFGIMSQITHISEHLEWPSSRPIPKDWAELQVMTAVDYGHDSYIYTYASGFLNYQVVHHLFPAIAPYHYPSILPIIKQTCKEFNIEYHALPNIWEAIKRHWSHLAQFQVYRERYYKRLEKEAELGGVKKPFSFVDVADTFIRGLIPQRHTNDVRNQKK